MNIFQPDSEQYTAALGGTVYVRLARGVVRGTGADRLDLLHRLSTNATRDLKSGDETTTILTSDKGRVIEVVRVLAFEDHLLMLLAGTDTGRVRAWLDKYTIMDDFATADAGAEYEVIGVYGDHAKSLASSALSMELPDAGKWTSGEIDGARVVALRDVRLTGAGGFLLLVPVDAAGAVITRLIDGGGRAIDENTYETLRIEAGAPAIGRELTESYNPLEAGLAQFISFNKGCYIGQEVIARLDTYDKVQRHLVGLRFQDDALPAGADAALEVYDAVEGTRIGAVTSLAHSPSLGRTIGLAYVRTNHAIPGAGVRVKPAGAGDEGAVAASIIKLPFDR